MGLIDLIRDIGKNVRAIEGKTDSLPELYTKESLDADYCLLVKIDTNGHEDVSKYTATISDIEPYSDFEMHNLRYAQGKVSVGVDISIGKSKDISLEKVERSLNFILPENKSTNSSNILLTSIVMKHCGMVSKQEEIEEFINSINIEEETEYTLCDKIDSLYGTGLLDDNKYINSACNIEPEIRAVKNNFSINNNQAHTKNISKLADTILKLIETKLNQIKISGTEKCLVGIQLDGKYPIELTHCLDKYSDKIYNGILKPYHEHKKCNFCGEIETVYTKIPYSFYSNDKGVYATNNSEGIFVCKECLIDMLTGRKFINKYSRAWWCDSNVWFIPYNLNTDLYDLLVYSGEDRSYGQKLINEIKEREIDILDSLGKKDSLMQIVFYDLDKSNGSYKIKHSISSLSPSRFSKLANVLKEHSIYYDTKEEKNKYAIMSIYEILCAIGAKVGKNDDINCVMSSSDILDILLFGKKMDMNRLYKLLMYVYISSLKKEQVLVNSWKMNRVNKVLSIFNKMGCSDTPLNIIDTQGGMNRMKRYENVDALFDDNRDYFSCDSKKAWFRLGMIYNYTVNKSREYYNSKSSHLEKNFVTNRTFNYTTFIYISNMCSKQLTKYSKFNGFAKSEIAEINSLMDKNDRLIEAEAAHAFFWGLSAYFKQDKQTETEIEEVTELEEVTESSKE